MFALLSHPSHTFEVWHEEENKFQNYQTLLQVAVVTVAFPATPLLLSRARICISAAHTREDLLRGLEV
jgi:7-keto-8-aminopelargonate synthetase-like enzyme